MIEPDDKLLFMIGAVIFIAIVVWVFYINIILICFVNDKIRNKSETYRRFEDYMKDKD